MGKLLTAIAVLSNASSIASLSEDIIKWKGFLLDGIHLYRQIVNPIRLYIVEHSSLTFTPQKMDLLVLFYMLFFIMFRTMRPILAPEYDASKSAKYLAVSFFIFFPLFTTWALGTRHFSSGFYYMISNIALICIVPAWTIFWKYSYDTKGFIFKYLVNKPDDVDKNMMDKITSRSIMFFINLLAIVLVFCLAAAINTALRG